MTQLTPKPAPRRGRIFPELTPSAEELAKQEAEDELFYQRCRAIFEGVRSEYIENHYGWYIAVEPDSGDYIIDVDREAAHKRASEKYPNGDHCVFCLNETGATGTI